MLKTESDNDAPVVEKNDWDAARRALACNWPKLKPNSPKYAALLEVLAEFHRRFGADRFDLRYNLRPPKDRNEEWTREFMHEQITEEELRSRLKSDAERPIDVEMLTTFCDAYQENLEHYSAVLQHAVLKPSETGTSAWRAKEKAIDEHVAVFRGKLPLWREHLETTFDFLEELRITSGSGLIKLGDFEATSAHWLAQLLFTRMSEGWRSCKEIAERSHQDPRYLYAARAIDLFYENWLPTFPAPQSVTERLREEFILARAALKRISSTTSPCLTTTQDLMSVGTSIERAIDNESRELVLIGEIFSLVARAGHIFRPTPNSDWGIDGEIEFKDGIGRATGSRLYVQLKSGDSHLVRRHGDGQEVFTVKNERHLEYWTHQAYPVMLVIRESSGLLRWMDVSAYLNQNGPPSRQIIFRGENLTPDSIQLLADRILRAALPDSESRSA